MQLPAPFLILALPRSRTAWLSHFLSYKGTKVGHDIAIECDSIESFIASYANGMAGSVETGAMMGWKIFKQQLPGLKLVIIRRPKAEVQRSLAKFGLQMSEAELETRNALLELIGRLDGVYSIEFNELASQACCQWLFEHCLEREFDLDWWLRLRNLNIQIDMPARIAQLFRRQEPLAQLKAEVISQSAQIPVSPEWLSLN